MKNEWFLILAKIAIFKGLSYENLNAVINCLQPKVYKYDKSDIIALDGIMVKGIGIVLSGTLAVSKENAAGKRMVIMTLKSGDMFGETTVFSESSAWNDTMYAQEECEILFLPREKLLGGCEAMCKVHKTLIVNMLDIVSAKALMLNIKVEYMAIKSLKEKLSNYLLEQYKNTNSLSFALPLRRNELADFLNVTRPSLSRELCRMRDEGIIEFNRSMVRIINLEDLKRQLYLRC